MSTAPGSYDNLDALDAATAPAPDASGQPSPDTGNPDELQSANIGPLVTFRTQRIEPPPDIYITVDDLIFFGARNLNPAQNALQLNMRLLRADGQIYSEVVLLNNVPSDGSEANVFAQLAEGFLLSAVVVPQTTNSQRGQTYVNVGIQRGTQTNGVFHEDLISDYISNNYQPTWPGNELHHSIEGPGHLRSIVGTVPAAGADILEVVPANVRWRLVSLVAGLTTSAVPGARGVTFFVQVGANVPFQMEAQVTQAPSTIVGYSVCPGIATSSAASLTQNISFPAGQSLVPGMSIKTVRRNGDVSDQWTAPKYTVEEWIEV